MIIEFEINGARIIVSGENLMINVTEAAAPQEDMPKVSFGLPTPSEIKDLRTSRGYTQAQFASLLRVAQSSISKWEAGSELPNSRSAFVLRKLMDGAA